PVGGTNRFDVVFTPPPGAALQYHQDHLTIAGTNSPVKFRVDLYALVTSSERGSVLFFVDNILTFPVPNATVRVKNTLLGQEFVTTTDANGFVTITNLQEGDWAWQANAAGHSANVGVLTIIPDQTTYVETRLSRSLVTVNFTVEPVPFTDRYDIKIEQTFETHVPAPVLVVTPPFLRFSNVVAGFEVTFIAVAKNHGLIQINDLAITGSDLAFGSLTPLIEYIPVLLPQESVEIPFRATYIGEPQAGQSQRVAANSQQFDGPGFADCATGGLVGLADFIRGLNAIMGGNADCADLKAILKVLAGVAVLYSLGCSPNFSPISIPGSPCPSKPWLWPFSFLVNLLSCLAQQIDAGSSGGSGPGGGGPIGTGSGYYGGNPACFVEGTDVLMADGSTKPIQIVRINDWVRSGYSTAERSSVTEVTERTSEDLYEITFGTDRTVIATGDHPFWVDGKGWTPAKALKSSQWLMSPAGDRTAVVAVNRVPGARKVYSLVLREDQAFFANGLLVQHRCELPWPAQPASPIITGTK
ncbi:MAG TPA: carboxypeptidase regulatory-like domain-containing protein, partial [Bryobacteraceae bacterium]|nr:carboxypeptidase regulatory-like domain-containing protein [Bryobacteraceae bacterium]